MSWAALAAAVIAIEVFADETLSSEYYRTYEKHPVLVTAATAYLVAHLYRFVPNRYDPLRRFL